MEYVYKNAEDTVRIKIFPRDGSGWDFDVWKRGEGFVYTHCVEGAEGYFERKRDAKAEAEAVFGKLKSIAVNTVTDGWEV